MFQKSFDIDLNISAEFGSWFAGWLDGEGCFRASLNQSRWRADGICIDVILKVTLRDDDRPLLEEVKNILGCGTIRAKSNETRRSQGRKEADSACWEVHSNSQLRHIIIPILDRYPLRSKKKRDYIIFRELVLRMYQGEHLKEGREYCHQLAIQLSEIKKSVQQ